MARAPESAREHVPQNYEDYEDYEQEGEEVFYYDEEDEDDYGPGVVVVEAEAPEPEPQTDLADEAYQDPLALVHAWEGALQDYKQSHPRDFLPPAEAPRSVAQRQKSVPFWYGPPPSEASTSKLPAPTAYKDLILPTAGAIGEDEDDEEEDQYAPQPVEWQAWKEQQEEAVNPKKRKRLTGSQKKARKLAKMGRGESNGAGSGDQKKKAAKSSPARKDAVLPTANANPSATAQTTASEAPAPTAAPTAAPAPAPPPAPAPAPPPAPALAPPPASAAPPTLPPPSAFRFVVPPISSLPRHFPSPPKITPLTGNEPPLEPESSEQLLESALWSWYSAGYQTALYHAAVGVAKFAPGPPAANGAPP